MNGKNVMIVYALMYVEKNARRLEQLLGSEDSLKTIDDLERVFQSFQINPFDENELASVTSESSSSLQSHMGPEDVKKGGGSDCRHGSCVVYRFSREVGRDKISMRFFKSPAEFMRSLPRPS